MLKQLLFLSLISVVICVDKEVRLAGGSDANIVNFPYTVAIHYSPISMYLCGGAILNKNTILTAARCVDWSTALSVRAGSSFHASGGQFVNVNAVHIHPKWNYTAQDYDVAILKIPDLIFNGNLQPIALPIPFDDVPAGSSVTVTGWGAKSYNSGVLPDLLQVAHMPIVDRAVCIALLPSINIPNVYPVISERNICAGNVGLGVCNGDLGGPLVWNNVLVGIISWGINPCGTSGYPTFFMRTSYFLDFIGTYL